MFARGCYIIIDTKDPLAQVMKYHAIAIQLKYIRVRQVNYSYYN